MTLTADRRPAEGGETATVTVDLGEPAPAGFHATVEVVGGTATPGGRANHPNLRSDFSMIPNPQHETRYDGTERWVTYLHDWEGQSQKTVTLVINDDDFVDPDETMALQGTGYIYAYGHDHEGQSGFANGQVQSNELTLTIADNDGGASGAADDPILIGAVDTTARESGTGADIKARVPVWLSREATQEVTVAYATTGGTATAGSDYTAVSGTLTFAAGETRKEVEITIKDDSAEDSGETFLFRLSSPTPSSLVSLSVAEATVTITNDEADLEGLKLWGAPASGGPYARVELGAFDAAVSNYAVTVPHGTTHAKLAGVAPQNARLGLKTGQAGSQLTAVQSDVAGPAVALAVGDTGLVVQATASSGEQKTYQVTVTREERIASANADLAGLTAETGADGTWSALDIGTFSAATTEYSATVPNGTTQARLTATTADANATLRVGSGSSLSAVSSGSASAAASLDIGSNALSVEVTAEDGTKKTYTVRVERSAPPKPLTASFENVPEEHDGKAAFTLDVRFSEPLGTGASGPTAASFDRHAGKVEEVEDLGSGVWRVKVQPGSWRDVTVGLTGGRDCSAAGAVCTADGRALENTVEASVGGPVRVRIEGGKAREGQDAGIDFAVTLNRASTEPVSVDYATADGTAKAGEA